MVDGLAGRGLDFTANRTETEAARRVLIAEDGVVRAADAAELRRLASRGLIGRAP